MQVMHGRKDKENMSYEKLDGFNDDGEIDNAERMFAAELLCTSREERIAFFGDAGDFDDADADDLDCMDNDSDED